MTDALSVTLETNRADYPAGEPIEAVLTVSWSGPGELALEFMTAQRFDIEIRNAEGEAMWRWSDGQMFGQVMGSERLAADRPSLRYAARFEGTLEPGTYTVSGLLASASHPLTAAVTVRVTP